MERTSVLNKARRGELKVALPVGADHAQTDADDSGHDELVSTLSNLAEVANENAKTAEESAFNCSELDDSFKHLNDRLKQILGQS